MTPDAPLNDDQRKVLETVEKLLRLADRNPNPEEAASAAARAQDLLLRHNLSADLVGTVGEGSAARREEATRGGFYGYQEQLWHAVAELNFCLHWVSGEYITRDVRTRDPFDGSWRTRTRAIWQKRHRLIGRAHNVAATKATATYLEQAVERLVMERLGDQNNQRFSRWAVSFRQGAVYDITKRIYARRRELLDEEAQREREAAARAEEAANKGGSTETAVTIASLTQSERDANIDHMMGEPGYSARMRAERAAEAAKRRAEEEAYTRWAAEHPDEARKLEAERAKEREKEEHRRTRTASSKGYKGDPGAWHAGRAAAEKVGLDLQAEGTKVRGLL